MFIIVRPGRVRQKNGQNGTQQQKNAASCFLLKKRKKRLGYPFYMLSHSNPISFPNIRKLLTASTDRSREKTLIS